MQAIKLNTSGRTQFIDITHYIKEVVQDSPQAKAVLVFVPHTTAGVTINENADPDVTSDMANSLDKIFPWQDGYAHMEGNSAAHLKATLVGSSVTIPIENGRMALGTWQGIYFCEFDGSRNRTCFVKVL